MSKPLQQNAFRKHIIGLDQASPLTAMPDEAAYDILNIEGDETGLISTRPGQSVFCRLPAAGTFTFDFTRLDGTQKLLAWAGTDIYNITSGTPASVLSGLTSGLVPSVTVINDQMVFGNGTDRNRKYDGTNFRNLSVPTPTGYPALATGVAGSISLTIGQKYIVTFVNSATGEESNPYQPDNLGAAPSTGVITAKRVDVTRPSVPGSDPQVDFWRIYKTQDGGGTYFRHGSDTAIGTTVYNDNVTVPSTAIELAIDHDEVPILSACVEWNGSLFFLPAAAKGTLGWTIPGTTSYAPPDNYEETFGELIGLYNHNKLLWVVGKKETWIYSEHPNNGGVPIKVADKGGVHKHGFSPYNQVMMSIAQSGYVYEYPPTEFSYSEIRYKLRSYNIKTLLDQVNKQQLTKIRSINFETKTKNQIWFSVPYGQGVTECRYVLVFDPTLAEMNKQKESWWIFKMNYNVRAISMVTISGEQFLFICDDQGTVYKYPDLDDGDGAEINGTATSADATHLNDTTQTWTVNAYQNLMVRIIAGTGRGQEKRITANTATQVTVDSSWGTTPDASSEYTIGGYTKQYFSNWKNFKNEALRKRFRFIRVVARQAGNYTIDVIVKKDFDGSEGNQKTLPFSLGGSSSLWGVMIWGVDSWGRSTVSRGRLKFHEKFNSIQVGFQNQKAGMPFQIEGFSTFHQGLYVRTKL